MLPLNCWPKKEAQVKGDGVVWVGDQDGVGRVAQVATFVNFLVFEQEFQLSMTMKSQLFFFGQELKWFW